MAGGARADRERPRLLHAVVRILFGTVALFAILNPRPGLAGAPAAGGLALDDPSTLLLHELRLRGIPLAASGAIRPFDAASVLDSLAAREARGATGAAAALLVLVREEMIRPPSSYSRPWLRAGFWLKPETGRVEGGHVHRKAALRGEVVAGWSEHVSGQWRGELDSNGGADTDFIGTPWKGEVTAQSDHAELVLRGAGWKIGLGRSRPAWSPFEAGLLLSGRHAPIDGAHAGITWGALRFAWLAGELDRIAVSRSEVAGREEENLFPADGSSIFVPRFVSAHRIEWQARHDLVLGASEAVLYGGPGRTWETRYLIPFVPYYSEQWNAGRDDNMMVSIDAEWQPAPGRRIAAELLIDDAQYSSGREPQEIAGAVSWSEVITRLPGEPRVEAGYTRVNSYVYGQGIPWNRWTLGRTTLGAPIGPDADRWSVSVTAVAGPRVLADLRGWRTRKGELEAEAPRPTVVGFLPHFPSGVVERRIGGQFGLAWFVGPQIEVRGWAGFEGVRALSHHAGEDHGDLLAGVALRIGHRFAPVP